MLLLAAIRAAAVTELTQSPVIEPTTEPATKPGDPLLTKLEAGESPTTQTEKPSPKAEENIPNFVTGPLRIMEETKKPYTGLPNFKFYLDDKAIIKSSLDLLFKESTLTIKEKEKILSNLLLTFKTTKPLVVNDASSLKYTGVVEFYNILAAHDVYTEIMKLTTELRTNFEFLHFIVESGKNNGVFSKTESMPFSLACMNCERILDELINSLPDNKDDLEKWKNSLIGHFQSISNRFKEETDSIGKAVEGNKKMPLTQIFANYFNKNLLDGLKKDLTSLENLLGNILNGIKGFKTDDQTETRTWEFCNYLLVAKSMAEFLSDLPKYKESYTRLGPYTHLTASKVSDLSLNLFAMSLGYNKKTYENMKSCLSAKNFAWWKRQNTNNALSGDIQFIAEIHEGNIKGFIDEAVTSLVSGLSKLKEKNLAEVSQKEIDALKNESERLSNRTGLLLSSTSDAFKSFKNDLETKFENEMTAFETLVKENKPEEDVIVSDEDKTPPPTDGGNIGLFFIILAFIAVIAALCYTLFGKKKEEVLE